MRKNKKAVLITGAGKRVGRFLALSLAELGWDLALHYNTSKDNVFELKHEAEALGANVGLFQADLSLESDFQELLEEVFEQFPQLCFLINNASVFKKTSFDQTSPSFLGEQIRINFQAPFFLTQQFARKCKKGNVLNFLDTRIAYYPTEHFAYTLSKKALYEFTLMAAKELAPTIRVNAIAPGLLLPPEGGSASRVEELVSKTPLKRQPQMEDIIKTMVFFLENESVTGQVTYINGGEHLACPS